MANENIFSIQATNGAQAFTVYFTCNMGGMSVAKVYTVVHSYGTTVAYNNKTRGNKWQMKMYFND